MRIEFKPLVHEGENLNLIRYAATRKLIHRAGKRAFRICADLQSIVEC